MKHIPIDSFVNQLVTATNRPRFVIFIISTEFDNHGYYFIVHCKVYLATNENSLAFLH